MTGDWTAGKIVRQLRRLGTRRNVDGMARFGIHAAKVFGVSKPKLDTLARKIGKDHDLALALWTTGIHDAKILAGMIDDPAKLTAAQMESWVTDFDNWDTCDGTCCHLFVFAEPAWIKAVAWTRRKEEFQKRAGFALAAYLAYRDKTAKDSQFLDFLKIIEREAEDERNFVRKAVNWALRNIGKRNLNLNRAAIATSERLRQRESRVARWIAGDALRELHSEAVQARFGRKEQSMAAKKGMRVRRVKTEDVQRLTELAGQLGYPTSVKEMKKRLRDVLNDQDAACFVAEDDRRRVLGWIHVSVTPLIEVERRAEVNGLIVDETLRSRGAGALLLRAGERWACGKKCKGTSVRSNVIREKAHGFYLRNGYEHYKTQKAFRKVL